MIEINNLNIYFGTGLYKIHAVKEVSFHVIPGECFGLVGESGSGKTTVLKAIVGLVLDQTGKITLDGNLLGKQRNRQFYKTTQMVFQDPYGSLHPRHTVNHILGEPCRIHKLPNQNKVIEKALDDVGLELKHRYRFPHQLSGGQRQRVAIARAVILKPKILLLDEPTSALDVSVQAEVLNLLNHLRKQYQMTYILVSHDLSVIAHMCDNLVVMNNGRIVERLDSQTLRGGLSQHPYTQQLLTASTGYDRESAENIQQFS